VQFNDILTKPFSSNIGSPQGDGLSPLLFAIYLEAAVRDLLGNSRLKRREVDELSRLPETLIYADDTDFLSFCQDYLDEVLEVVVPLFKNEYKLIVNADKTERTRVGHLDMGVDQSAWRGTRKLGSLLGAEEDVARRIQLANVSFGKLEALWKHRSCVAQAIRIKSYRALVESVLLYNCGTWALSSALADRLDRAQRKMLRKVIGLTWKHKVTNENLYAMCGCKPASVQVIKARWRLFGHVLRMNENVPARQAMALYFEGLGKDIKGRQGNFCSIASVLSDDYKKAFNKGIKTKSEYEAVAMIAQDRVEWKSVVAKVTGVFCELRGEKITKRREARKAKEALQKE
jgi:hypothetical protein